MVDIPNIAHKALLWLLDGILAEIIFGGAIVAALVGVWRTYRRAWKWPLTLFASMAIVFFGLGAIVLSNIWDEQLKKWEQTNFRATPAGIEDEIRKWTYQANLVAKKNPTPDGNYFSLDVITMGDRPTTITMKTTRPGYILLAVRLLIPDFLMERYNQLPQADQTGALHRLRIALIQQGTYIVEETPFHKIHIFVDIPVARLSEDTFFDALTRLDRATVIVKEMVALELSF